MIGVTCACSRCRRYGNARFAGECCKRELGEDAVVRRAVLHAVGDLAAMMDLVQHREAIEDRERRRMEGRGARGGAERGPLLGDGDGDARLGERERGGEPDRTRAGDQTSFR